ncbi:hypothetical protein [Lysinibacillus contaminans]|uniref:hypothetical protein n=1 Tax=Lysinibacillus contaminans TaxID=1293441 RepID=UPI001B803839|nr:hypothetical protein [Lysinibacillus contaminans]
MVRITEYLSSKRNLYYEEVIRIRKFFTIFLVIVSTIVFSACSNNTDIPKSLSKEGVAPYELSESDTYLLESLGLEKDTNIVSFKAPKTARSLKVNVYTLKDDDTWSVMGGGQVLLGPDANPDDSLEGTFAMILKDNYAVDFNINTTALASYKTDTLDVDYEILASSIGFLTDFQKIEINKEIPVAIMIYDSGSSMESYAMEDFFSPSRFEEMDLVQAVTLTFTDENH